MSACLAVTPNRSMASSWREGGGWEAWRKGGGRGERKGERGRERERERERESINGE